MRMKQLYKVICNLLHEKFNCTLCRVTFIAYSLVGFSFRYNYPVNI